MSKRIDHIRAMNAEELAELLDDIAEDATDAISDAKDLRYPPDVKSFAAWLMEEAD